MRNNRERDGGDRSAYLVLPRFCCRCKTALSQRFPPPFFFPVLFLSTLVLFSFSYSRENTHLRTRSKPSLVLLHHINFALSLFSLSAIVVAIYVLFFFSSTSFFKIYCLLSTFFFLFSFSLFLLLYSPISSCATFTRDILYGHHDKEREKKKRKVSRASVTANNYSFFFLMARL